MLKKDEVSSPSSCLNRAKEEEMLFVLLARDVCAPIAIRAWVNARIATGKNQKDDPQIKEALDCAYKMEVQRDADHS